MNDLTKAIFLTLIAVGCSWTPERLNPYDPSSPVYVDPPVPNRSPSVDTLIVNTNCVNFPTEDQCGVVVLARLSDPDENLNFDNVVVTINGRMFGQMVYDAPQAMWVLTKQETELDSAAERYVGSVITVTVEDDSGATAQRSVLYPNLFREYPTPRWPLNPANCICPEYRFFSWDRWNGEGQATEMEIRFYYSNFDLVPSLTVHDISPQDTTVWVEWEDREFFPSDSNNLIFYGWRLFVVDQNGNRAGSTSGTFNYREICTDLCGQ